MSEAVRVTGRSEESLNLRTKKSTSGPSPRRTAPAPRERRPAEPAHVRGGPVGSAVAVAVAGAVTVAEAVAEPCLSSTYRKPRTAERTQPRAPLRPMKGRPSDAP